MAGTADDRTILIVDDEQPIRDMLRCFFETKGYVVRAAACGREAVGLISQDPPSLVVMDVRMPGMSGLEVLKRMKKLDERIPVVLITGHGEIGSAVAAMKLGAEDYLSKPLKLTDLLRVVESVLAESQAVGGLPPVLSSAGVQIPLEELMGRSPEIQAVYRLVEQVAQTDLTVLVYGETGSGKSLVAGAVHNASRRAAERFVRVDCGAIPDTLIESELFGHERGAFTGAERRTVGYFELAHRGTLFLDEIANLSQAMMRKLLCALEDRHVYRVGGTEPIPVDIRVVAASNQNLDPLVDQGGFRRDLFHRLNEFVIEIPPLRERRADISFLVERFVRLANAELGKKVEGPSPAALKQLENAPWPGNVRELRNVLKRAVLLSRDVIEPEHLRAASVSCAQLAPLEVQAPDAAPTFTFGGHWSLKDITRECIRQIEQKVIGSVLEHTGGNKSKAARLLNVDYKTLYYKAKDMGY